MKKFYLIILLFFLISGVVYALQKSFTISNIQDPKQQIIAIDKNFDDLNNNALNKNGDSYFILFDITFSSQAYKVQIISGVLTLTKI